MKTRVLTQKERVELTQELAAISQILVLQYQHPGFLMYTLEHVARMEKRHTLLCKSLYDQEVV